SDRRRGHARNETRAPVPAMQPRQASNEDRPGKSHDTGASASSPRKRASLPSLFPSVFPACVNWRFGLLYDDRDVGRAAPASEGESTIGEPHIAAIARG